VVCSRTRRRRYVRPPSIRAEPEDASPFGQRPSARCPRLWVPVRACCGKTRVRWSPSTSLHLLLPTKNTGSWADATPALRDLRVGAEIQTKSPPPQFSSSQVVIGYAAGRDVLAVMAILMRTGKRRSAKVIISCGVAGHPIFLFRSHRTFARQRPAVWSCTPARLGLWVKDMAVRDA